MLGRGDPAPTESYERRIKMKKLSLLLTTAFIFLSGSLAQAQTKYEIDAAHSTLGFAVKHMGVSTTRGAFSDFKGTIDYDPAIRRLLRLM